MDDLDQRLLVFVAAHEVTLAEQAAPLLQIAANDTHDRLEQLRTQRLVSRARLSSRLPPAYRITRHGTDQLDSPLPPLRALDPARYRHEIGLGWLSAAARTGRFGEHREILTRREMQAADTTGRTATLLHTPGATFQDQPTEGGQVDPRHAYPDLGLVQANGEWIPLDIILTTTSAQQLRIRLSRCQRHPQIVAHLLLLEHHEALLETVEATIAELRVTDKVFVRNLAPDGIAGA